IAGTVAGQAIADKQSDHLFSGVTIVDTVSPQPTLTLTVTLDNAADGTLSNLGGGTYNTITGVYTDTGIASAVATALDGLVFTPTLAPGTTVTTTFTIGVNDDTGGSTATDSSTSVVASSVLGGGQTVGFCGSPGYAASLYDTGGDPDTVNGSNGTVYLTSAQASVSGGGDTIIFVGGSGNVANLSDTGGDPDTVNGSNGTVYLTSAQASVSGGGDTIVFIGGAGNVARRL